MLDLAVSASGDYAAAPNWLCLLFGVCVLAGGATAALLLYLRNSRRRGSSAFPVIPIPPGPGRFRVWGVDRATKADRVWECGADSPENAHVKAELEGIIVTRVERV